MAARILEQAGSDEPAFVRFGWTYGDPRGDIAGEGAARYNPLDSMRLDLFTSGDVAMSVALAGDRLSSLGQIEDVEVPPRAFLFAMAGLFRPGGESPAGYVAGADTVLTYGEPSRRLYFWVETGRIAKVEERRNGRLHARVELTWADGPWPAQAAYRDFDRPSRVKWTTEEVRVQEEPFPTDIFLLDHVQ